MLGDFVFLSYEIGILGIRWFEKIYCKVLFKAFEVDFVGLMK